MERRVETRPKLPELSFRGLSEQEASQLFDACAEADMQVNCHYGSKRVEVIKPYNPVVKKESALPIMTAASKIRIVYNPSIPTFAQD